MPPWDGDQRKMTPKDYTPVEHFTVGDEDEFKKGYIIFVRVYKDSSSANSLDIQESCPAKILAIFEKKTARKTHTKILIAYYMHRTSIEQKIHMSNNNDNNKWAALLADWTRNGKYWALTNELQEIDISMVDGQNSDLLAEIDYDYVLFWHGWLYKGRPTLKNWSDIQAKRNDGWWNMDERLKVYAAATSEEDIRAEDEATENHIANNDDAESTIESKQTPKPSAVQPAPQENLPGLEV
ncbi:hypothetical protein WAI453_013559 [Rhynchosporium graminicola]